jgi:hypothetical protein
MGQPKSPGFGDDKIAVESTELKGMCSMIAVKFRNRCEGMVSGSGRSLTTIEGLQPA